MARVTVEDAVSKVGNRPLILKVHNSSIFSIHKCTYIYYQQKHYLTKNTHPNSR